MTYKTIPFLLLVLAFAVPSRSQSKAEREILSILDRQTAAWNRGDLEGFMNGYWENDSLMYIGKNGVTYGFKPTLSNYRRNYGDTARMGKLRFDILHVKRLSSRYYHVVGRWSLRRSAGDVGGHYTLLFRRIRGEWVIVSDHSS
jgi:hypothetical protein